MGRRSRRPALLHTLPLANPPSPCQQIGAPDHARTFDHSGGNVEQIPWAIVGPWSGWAAFIALALLMARKVANGDWVPRVTHERELDAAQHDANEWRAEGRIKDQAILVDLGHVKKTTEETGKSLHHFLNDLQRVRPPRTTGDD